MGIYRGGYRQYEGEMLSLKTRFGVVFQAEFTRLFRGKWNRRLMLLAAVPLIIFVAVLIGKGFLESKAGTLPIQVDLLDKLLATELTIMALLAATAGAGLIADDRRTNALALYLSRPLSPRGYLAGKGLALGAVLAIVYLAPALVYILFANLFAPRFDLVGLLGDLCLTTLISGSHVTITTVVLLLLSSLGRRSRYVGLVWVAIYFFSKMVGQAVAAALQKPELVDYLSIPDLYVNSARWMLNPQWRDPIPAAILAVLGIAAGAFLWHRLRSMMRMAVQG